LPLDVAFDVLGAEAEGAADVDGGELAARPDVPEGGAADVEEAKDIRELEEAIVWNGSEGRHVFLLDQARGWELYRTDVPVSR
jgi:hypothetical protein